MSSSAIGRLIRGGLVAISAFTICACVNGSGIGDGGAGGTGIGSATIQGNVMMDGVTSLANVRVHARGTALEALTDETGFFELVGIDAGDVTLEFRRTSDRKPATVDVFAASGSIVTLTDVNLVGDDAEPKEIDLSNIVGTVVGDAECEEAGRGTFDVDDGEITFSVRIDPDTVVAGSDASASCTDLVGAAQVRLTARQDGLEIVATRVAILHPGVATP